MTYQEAMAQLIRLRSLMAAGGDDSVFTESDRDIIEDIHYAENGEKVRECGCRDRYCDAVIELYRKLKRKNRMASEQKYMLRPGVLIWVGTEVYSKNNITDEIAAAYLKLHPEHRSKFERVPAEYKSKAVKKMIKEAEADNVNE